MSASASHGKPYPNCRADASVATLTRTEASGEIDGELEKKDVLATASTAAEISRSKARKERQKKHMPKFVTVSTHTDSASTMTVDAEVQGEPDHELMAAEVTMARLRRERDEALMQVRCLKS